MAIPLPFFNLNQGNLLSAMRRVDKAKTDAEIAYLNATQALADAHQWASIAQEQIESMRSEILPAAQSAFNAAVTGFELAVDLQMCSMPNAPYLKAALNIRARLRPLSLSCRSGTLYC